LSFLLKYRSDKTKSIQNLLRANIYLPTEVDPAFGGFAVTACSAGFLI
jgi:hypothetical protein